MAKDRAYNASLIAAYGTPVAQTPNRVVRILRTGNNLTIRIHRFVKGYEVIPTAYEEGVNYIDTSKQHAAGLIDALKKLQPTE